MSLQTGWRLRDRRRENTFMSRRSGQHETTSHACLPYYGCLRPWLGGEDLLPSLSPPLHPPDQTLSHFLSCSPKIEQAVCYLALPMEVGTGGRLPVNMPLPSLFPATIFPLMHVKKERRRQEGQGERARQALPPPPLSFCLLFRRARQGLKDWVFAAPAMPSPLLGGGGPHACSLSSPSPALACLCQWFNNMTVLPTLPHILIISMPE